MTTEKLIEVIVDVATGEVVELELSPERVAKLEAQQALSIQAQEVKETARASALAKLAALGLTEAEIAAL
jgi:hypothetical protein